MPEESRAHHGARAHSPFTAAVQHHSFDASVEEVYAELFRDETLRGHHFRDALCAERGQLLHDLEVAARLTCIHEGIKPLASLASPLIRRCPVTTIRWTKRLSRGLAVELAQLNT